MWWGGLRKLQTAQISSRWYILQTTGLITLVIMLVSVIECVPFASSRIYHKPFPEILQKITDFEGGYKILLSVFSLKIQVNPISIDQSLLRNLDSYIYTRYVNMMHPGENYHLNAPLFLRIVFKSWNTFQCTVCQVYCCICVYLNCYLRLQDRFVW